MRDSETFDEAIAKYFAPIAGELGLPLTKVDESIYEIPSPHFILRIRLHTGHRRGFNVIVTDLIAAVKLAELASQGFWAFDRTPIVIRSRIAAL